MRKHLVLVLLGITASGVQAQDTQLLWGDTHLHSSWSVDAYSNGNTSADPETAYRYAMGLPVLHPGTRERIRIDRPLDFLVVADHAEMLQLQVRLGEGDPLWLATSSGERLAPTLTENIRAVFGEVVQIQGGQPHPLLDDFHQPALRLTAWQRQTALAEQYNRPGEFTALIGWEWSSAPGNANLHRVVFTPADASIASKFIPMSYYDSMRPEDLWQFLEDTSVATGADFVAIPHNANMSDGRMFDRVDSEGRALTAEYNRTRLRWEPVMEITQVKGSSETMPELSPDDPFAGFEVRNKLLIGTPSAIAPGSYARGALREGLVQEAATGVNPFRFGMIGSTDSHTGIVSVEEDNFYGKMVVDTLPEQRVSSQANFAAWEMSAGGLAAVWATENSRQAIAEAFQRKEVYASSGPRISVRLFGGFDFSIEDAQAPNLPATGYAKGVPMGSDLTAAPAGEAPSFLIEVLKDPLGANLDRVQVVKGWLDNKGNTHESVFDVAWSGERQPGADGLVPAVGNTVDADTASWRNSIGTARLATVWRDPAFDPGQLAFYYLRALEIPTPRHQVYDAVALGIDPADTGQPVSIQERAWSSPIWYTP